MSRETFQTYKMNTQIQNLFDLSNKIIWRQQILFIVNAYMGNEPGVALPQGGPITWWRSGKTLDADNPRLVDVANFGGGLCAGQRPPPSGRLLTDMMKIDMQHVSCEFSH